MRTPTSLVIALSLSTLCTAAPAAPTPAAKAAAPHQPAPTPGAQAGEVTTAYGTIPDSLAGTWFVVLSMKVGERYLNGWLVYKITHHGTKWQVNEFHGAATPLLQQEIQAADAQGAPYTPSAAVLAARKDLLPPLKPVGAASRAETITLRARGHFADTPAKEPRLEWAKLVIDFFGKGENVRVSGQTYFVKDITPDRLAGEKTTANIATAPGGAMVPISLAGPFAMYRIE